MTKLCSREYLSMRFRAAQEQRERAISGKPKPASSGVATPSQVTTNDVTKDPIQKRIALYQRLIAPLITEDRTWWSMGGEL